MKKLMCAILICMMMLGFTNIAYAKPKEIQKQSTNKITKAPKQKSKAKKRTKSTSNSKSVRKQSNLKINSTAALLMDLNTGKLIYSKNIHERLAPASTTKILTAIITLEKCNLNNTVVIGKEAPLEEPSKIDLKEGEKISVHDLLYALMLDSANDAATALAVYISGSKEKFGKLMTEKAKAIGCKDSNFVNPNGLYQSNHYTSAYDLALITKYAMKNPVFDKLVSTTNYVIPSTNMSAKRSIINHNKMLYRSSYYYKGCIGVKTGYTSQAHHTLVSAAAKGGKKLLAVMLRDKTPPYYDAITLFNYGFSLKK